MEIAKDVGCVRYEIYGESFRVSGVDEEGKEDGTLVINVVRVYSWI